MAAPNCLIGVEGCDGPGSYRCTDVLWGSPCRREQERRDAGPEQERPAEQLARRFHEAYERLAPEHGYSTREASRTEWRRVPERNRRLMVAVAQEIIDGGPPA